MKITTKSQGGLRAGQRRSNPRIAVFLLLCAASMGAQALNYTSGCDNDLTSADRQLFEDAFSLVNSLRYDVEDHINDTRSSGNADNYSFIAADRMQDWRGRVDAMAQGNVKVACQYNASNRECRNKPGLFGETFTLDPLVGLRDRVEICINNVRATGQGATGRKALLAGTLAHELMHHVDGIGPAHTNGGTNPANPTTPSETIGVAMENLVLTPDLRARFDRLDVVQNGNNYDVDMAVSVSNLNPDAVVGIVPLSGLLRNPTNTTVDIDVGGDSVCTATINPLAPLTSTVIQCNASVPAYIPAADPERVITAKADDLNQIIENNEANNVTSITFDTEVDLAVSVEVAAAPQCHHIDIAGGEIPEGPYGHWLEIPYRVTVTNLDTDTGSPSVDLVMIYDDLSTWTPRITQDEIMLPPIGPLASHTEIWAVNVPTDPLCTGPGTLAADIVGVDFVADWNAISIHDVDRGNNYVSLVIDRDYWRPNHALREVTLLGTVPAATRNLSYAVRNIGPTRAGSGLTLALSRTRVTDASGNAVHSAMTPDLAPGSQQTYVAAVTVEACNDVHYTLEADYQDTIDEYDESDNVAGVTIEPHHISGASTLGGSFGTLGDCNGPDLAQFEHMLEQEGGLDGLLEHKLEGLNYEQWGTDNRGNDMDIGPGAPILDRLED